MRAVVERSEYRLPRVEIPYVPPCSLQVSADFKAKARIAWGVAALKVRHLVEAQPDAFPLYTQDGTWTVHAEAWTPWCEGFLAGQLWLLADHSLLEDDRRWFRSRAEHYTRLIEHRKDDRSTHDLGFLFWSSWRRWVEATGDAALNTVVVEAGRTMALRFMERGRYLRSFLAPNVTFIDVMMNVGIMFYAARYLEDDDLGRVAYEHCLTTRKFLVRGDGSTSHAGVFDLQTGAFVRQTTEQGWRNDSSWARGQAWAIHGFVTAYRHTGDRRFLSTARACADFYIEHTSDRLVPPNDLDDPEPDRPFESSAAAIAAGGLWRLAGLVENSAVACRYGSHAIQTLDRLCDPEFLSVDDPMWEGILKHGTYHEGKHLGIDESVMWGDYWFLDALDMVAPELSFPVAARVHTSKRSQGRGRSGGPGMLHAGGAA